MGSFQHTFQQIKIFHEFHFQSNSFEFFWIQHSNWAIFKKSKYFMYERGLHYKEDRPGLYIENNLNFNIIFHAWGLTREDDQVPVNNILSLKWNWGIDLCYRGSDPSYHILLDCTHVRCFGFGVPAIAGVVSHLVIQMLTETTLVRMYAHFEQEEVRPCHKVCQDLTVDNTLS